MEAAEEISQVEGWDHVEVKVEASRQLSYRSWGVEEVELPPLVQPIPYEKTKIIRFFCEERLWFTFLALPLASPLPLSFGVPPLLFSVVLPLQLVSLPLLFCVSLLPAAV